MMLVGALAGFGAANLTSNPALAVIVAMIAGGMLAMVHAFVCIGLRGDQIVSGLALTLFGTGLTGFLGRAMVGKTAPGFGPIALPGLSQIPVIGPVLFQHDLLVYLAYLLVPVAWFVLYRTRLGLSIRSVGESPEAADASGVNVSGIRYGCTFVGGALAGVGGAYLSLAYTTMWIEQMSGGRGWIALALVIFAAWNPMKALWGAYLFGGVDSLSLYLQARGAQVSAHLLMMLPYIVTVLVLWVATRRVARARVGAPAALALAYAREERH
jgi:simple sugar transport system permease protein